MSRLEQMREHFLQRVYNEQLKEAALSLAKSSISCAKSTQNLSLVAALSPNESNEKYIANRLKASLSVRPTKQHSTPRSTLARVRSWNSITLQTPERFNSSGKFVSVNSDKLSGGAKPSVVQIRRSIESSVNNGCKQLVTYGTVGGVNPTSRVSRPSQSLKTLGPLESRRVASSVKSTKQTELQCKHCSRKFAAKERLDKHAEICAKTFHKQRPVFNSAKQRQVDDCDGMSSASTSVNLRERTDESTSNQSSQEAICSLSEPTVPVESGRRASNTSWKDSHQSLLEAIKKARSEIKLEDKLDIDVEVNLSPCSYCHRKFGREVILRHETICGKLFRKKNFDV